MSTRRGRSTPICAAHAPAGNVAALIAYANQHFELAQAALRNGDFATYGVEIAKVQQALQELNQLVPPATSPNP